jgi:hypothetical protein
VEDALFHLQFEPQQMLELALSALGLDPGLGVGLHTDTANRDSLALDVLEPVRPQVETCLLDWVASEPLRKADFFETATGNCRLMSKICTKLSGTASVWGKLVAPWAEYVARTLWAGAKSRRTCNSIPPTRLTQQRRTEAKGKVWIAAVEPPKTDHLCRGCGKIVPIGRSNCAACAIGGATERLVSAAKLGRVAARSPEARAKHVASRRRHAQACSAWDASTQPAWLTGEFYCQKIQPLLVGVSSSAIAAWIGCRAGTLAASVRVIGRIRGTGRRWRNWWVFGKRCERSRWSVRVELWPRDTICDF